MKRMTTLLLVLGAVFLTTGCDKVSKSFSAEDSCSSEVAKKTIREMFVDAVEVSAREENKSNANDPSALRFDLAKIRATADGIGLALEDVITTKKDPNSTKKFCEAQLTLTIPSAVLGDANALRKDVGEGTIQNLAEDEGFRVDLEKFKSKISYSVQPTDSGDKLYTEVEGFAKFTDLMSTTVKYAALKALRVASQGGSTQKAQEKLQQESAEARGQLENSASSGGDGRIQPSFDCEKAGTAIENLICSDNELAKLDLELNRDYKGVIALFEANGDPGTFVKDEQKKWLKEQRGACLDRACLKNAYTMRLEQLSAYAD